MIIKKSIRKWCAYPGDIDNTSLSAHVIFQYKPLGVYENSDISYDLNIGGVITTFIPTNNIKKYDIKYTKKYIKNILKIFI